MCAPKALSKKLKVASRLHKKPNFVPAFSASLLCLLWTFPEFVGQSPESPFPVLFQSELLNCLDEFLFHAFQFDVNSINDKEEKHQAHPEHRA